MGWFRIDDVFVSQLVIVKFSRTHNEFEIRDFGGRVLRCHLSNFIPFSIDLNSTEGSVTSHELGRVTCVRPQSIYLQSRKQAGRLPRSSFDETPGTGVLEHD